MHSHSSPLPWPLSYRHSIVTSSQGARSSGKVAGQSAGSQQAQVCVSSEHVQVVAPIVQSPRPGVHALPFAGTAAGHICAARRQFQPAETLSSALPASHVQSMPV